MFTKILVPLNASASAEKTVRALVAQREQFSAALTLIHVIDPSQWAYKNIPQLQQEMIRDNALKSGEHLLKKHFDVLASAGIAAETRIELGSPRQMVCAIANDEGFDLVILGRRGTGEIRDVLFGSVANYALHNVDCPVLLF